MIAKLKLAAYVILVALAIWFYRDFRKSYSAVGLTTGVSVTNTTAGQAGDLKPGASNQPLPRPAQEMGTSQATNHKDATNTVVAADTNAAPQPGLPESSPTNATASNSAAAVPSPAGNGAPAAATPQSNAVRSMVELVGVLIGLGILLAYDLTHYLGSRATAYLFDDLGEGMRDPEYERAEQVWVNGKPLEAIELMREYLKKNPREQFVALRIAEIYEKDLRNYVAASMEYEEILKKKLPDERWGRAAIHLCNVYSRMGKQDNTRALLDRIVKEYPKTAAAKKARQNLGLPEPAEEAAAPAPPPEPVTEPEESEGEVFDLDQMIAAADEEAASQTPEAAPQEPPSQEPTKSKLPPGFRKKR